MIAGSHWLCRFTQHLSIFWVAWDVPWATLLIRYPHESESFVIFIKGLTAINSEHVWTFR